VTSNPTAEGRLSTPGVRATRRQLLKGGLAAGAAAVWATPVVEVLTTRAAAAASAPPEHYATSCSGPATYVAFTYLPSANNFGGATSATTTSVTKGDTTTVGNPSGPSGPGGPSGPSGPGGPSGPSGPGGPSGPSGPGGPSGPSGPGGGLSYKESDYGLVFSYASSSEPSNGVTGNGASGVVTNNGEPPSSAYIVLSSPGVSSPGVSSSRGPYFTNASSQNLGTTTTVSSGDVLSVNPNRQIFLEFKIYDNENGTLYQDLVVHVSCSDPAVQPATEGIFQIGSLKLYSFVPGSGPGSGGGPGPGSGGG